MQSKRKYTCKICKNVLNCNVKGNVKMLYNNLSGYFRKKYGKRLKKICIDGGFFCPNRDGKCGTGGCIYCGERGAGEHIDASLSIREQVMRALDGAGEEELFVAYFQNFSNTYAPPSVLRERYDAALIDRRIIALAIGTRPDCINEENAALIAEYKERVDVWVELGLQTANDGTARIINRGYETAVFASAVSLLTRHGIPTVAHIIIGLPNENGNDALESVKYATRAGIWGIKLHSIYVMGGTRLAELYESGQYTPPTLEEYASAAATCIANIPKSVIIHRITGDCPKDMLIAPKWNADKTAVIAAINAELEGRGLAQGSMCDT